MLLSCSKWFCFACSAIIPGQKSANDRKSCIKHFHDPTWVGLINYKSLNDWPMKNISQVRFLFNWYVTFVWNDQLVSTKEDNVRGGMWYLVACGNETDRMTNP